MPLILGSSRLSPPATVQAALVRLEEQVEKLADELSKRFNYVDVRARPGTEEEPRSKPFQARVSSFSRA